MLGDAGSIASVAGVAISIVGLAIAIWQLRRLRGEARAAQEAAEQTRRLLERELATAELSSIIERIVSLLELHRNGEWRRALDRYPDIRSMLNAVRIRHPNLTGEHHSVIQEVLTQIGYVERAIARGNTSERQSNRFDTSLREAHQLLSEIASQLQASAEEQ